MKTITAFLYLLVFTYACKTPTAAQHPPFWDEIQAFKKQDSTHPPPKNAILFTGSSSFRLWGSLQNDFPDYTIINRAFGGSTFPDVIRYADDVIFKYKPKQVVIYCGDNDLASKDSVSAKTVAQRFRDLYKMIRKKLPDASVVYVSIKPSPSRAQLMPKMVEANQLIKNFIATEKNTSFVDVYHLMLAPDGSPKKELFLEDNLHMKPSGYVIWQQAIKPYLLK
ncbi:MAG: GDSL-type esterase/lipase family protein [Flavisolibacter sp.]